MSELTVASLTDLGFEVDLKKADPFSLLKPAKTRKHRRGRFQRRNTHQRIQFINDVQHYPYEEVKNVIPKPGREAEYMRDKQNYNYKRKLRLEKRALDLSRGISKLIMNTCKGIPKIQDLVISHNIKPLDLKFN